MGGILPAEVAVFGKRELLFYLLLVALGVMRDAAALAALHLRHRVLDLAHNISLAVKFKTLLLYVKNRVSSTL